MNLDAKLYKSLVLKYNTNTMPANRQEVEAAICDLCEYWEEEANVPKPEHFIWFDSPLAANTFIDANATVLQNGAKWKGWDFIDGARPPFHCGWGAYYSYIIAAFNISRTISKYSRYYDIQEALLRAGPWYIFEGAAICIDTPEKVELDDFGFITYIKYRDGVEYTMVKEGDKVDYPPRFSPEYSMKEITLNIDTFMLGQCLTENITNLDDVATAVCNNIGWLHNDDINKHRRFGRRSMFSLHAMGVSTVNCVLNKRKYLGLISTVRSRVAKP